MYAWEQLRTDLEAGAKALVASYSGRLYKFAYRLCSDSAMSEDLTIRTLARAVKAEGEFKSEPAYFSFLCAILVNLRRDDLRLKAANALVFMDEIPDVADSRPDPLEALAAKSDAEAVRMAVSRLSPVLRETVVMRYFADLPVAGIAEALAVPEGTVKFRLSEGRRRIREFLSQRNVGIAR